MGLQSKVMSLSTTIPEKTVKFQVSESPTRMKIWHSIYVDTESIAPSLCQMLKKNASLIDLGCYEGIFDM
jgi:hypothetical protein